jgi:outer membrane protein insertion porin family
MSYKTGFMPKLAMILAVYGLLVSLCVPLFTGKALAQGPGGGGGDPSAGAPAFNDPKFRDRVWEMGGPRFSEIGNGKLIVGMEIVGNQSISDHKILSYMQTRADRRFDEKQLMADIHELYRTELFRKVTPSLRTVESGVIVKLEIVENPTVLEVVFHGNRRLDDSMLKKHCGIEIGDPINPISVDMARERLINLYQEHAFNQTAIVVREGNKSGDRRIFFEIAEGPLERIWDIHFEGNVVFTDAILKTKIKSKDARGGVMNYWFNKANLIQVREDVDRLANYYRSLGYFEAKIDHRLDYYDSGDLVKVVFVIYEGPQFQIRNISLMGNKFFTTEELMAAMALKPGEAFNLGKMKRDQRTLRNEFYGRKGFVFVDIQPEPRYLEEPGQIDLVYKITEGDIYRAGEIIVRIDGDSSHTKHNVALNMIGIRPGQIIDLQELEDSERRLKFSQIFETNPAQGEPPSIEVVQPDANLQEYLGSR